MSGRFHTMRRADFRRMFTSPMLYILCLAALVMPILILVMTSMASGATVSTMEAFTSAWQIIGSEGGAMSMDMTAMCNINLIFFMAGVYACLFIAEDFRSGFAKNLFAVRSKKRDYVASKTLAGCVAGGMMLVCFFIGAVLGGAFAGLSFTLGRAGVFGLIMCMLSKLALMGVFTSIAVAAGAFAKQRSWLSILTFGFGGMLLFMMIPMLTPLDAGIMNLGLCLAGSAMFAFGLGAVSNLLLSRRDLVE